jgi:hypothetical protein
MELAHKPNSSQGSSRHFALDCTMILKPSKIAPLSGMLFCRNDWINLVFQREYLIWVKGDG